MRAKKRPDPQANGESGQNKKQKYFCNRQHEYTKKFDKFLFKKIANQNLGFVSSLARRVVNRLEQERRSA
jgi:hypothetical protein